MNSQHPISLDILKENIESLKYALQLTNISSCSVEKVNGPIKDTFMVVMSSQQTKMSGFIYSHGTTYNCSFPKRCTPLFRNWLTDLLNKMCQIGRTQVYKQELFEKTSKIDLRNTCLK